MRKKIIYIIIILLMFTLMYRLNKEQPADFVWEPTYHTQDKEPYGGYALDKLLKASWEKGYTHSYKSISNLNEKGSLDGNNLLIITENFAVERLDVKALFDYVRDGGTAFIAARHYNVRFRDILKFYVGYEYFSNIRVLLNVEQKYKTFYFCTPGLDKENYIMPAEICSGFFSFDEIRDSTFVIAKSVDKEEKPITYHIVSKKQVPSSDKEIEKIVTIRCQIGKGSLILSCNPLIYTNYGILNDTMNMFIWNSFALLQDKPLIRTEYYHAGSNAAESQSPLRYLLSKKPLRWALNITIITIFIFMIFTAKRKQKPIPIVKPPANRMLEFVRSIAGLYIQKNNNADIILKKYTFWADSIKRKYGIDIINEKRDNELFNRLSSKTGKKVEELNNLIRYLDSLDKNSRVSDSGMMEIVTKINSIK